MLELTWSFGGLVVITIGIVEVIKRAVGLNNNLLPLVGLVVGVVLVVLANFTGLTALPILGGLVVGLSAAGLYDQKKIIER